MNWKLAPWWPGPDVPDHRGLFGAVPAQPHPRPVHQACDESEGVLSTIAQENLTGVRVVRAFGRENFERERFEKQNQDIMTDALGAACARLLSAFWARWRPTTAMHPGDAGRGDRQSALRARRDDRGRLRRRSPSYNCHGHLAGAAAWPRDLGDVQGGRFRRRASATFCMRPSRAGRAGRTGAGLDGRDIVFDHVTFRYDDGTRRAARRVVHDPGGEHASAILGGTGSGKSTSAADAVQALRAERRARHGRRRRPRDRCPTAWVREHVGVVPAGAVPLQPARSAENIGITRRDMDVGEIRRGGVDRLRGRDDHRGLRQRL